MYSAEWWVGDALLQSFVGLQVVRRCLLDRLPVGVAEMIALTN